MKTKFIKIKDIEASSEQGFTLIELLVVIGILAILMGIVLIAINPAHQFQLSNDTNRRNAVAQILSGVGQYEAEHSGKLPPGLNGVTTTPVAIAGPTAAGKADLCTDLVGGPVQYMPALPADPTTSSTNGVDIPVAGCASYDSGYQVSVDANNRVTIYAPHYQAAPSEIQVTR